MIQWAFWLGCGLISGFKNIDDEFIDKIHENNEKMASREITKFSIWFFTIILGSIGLIICVIDDIVKLFRKIKS
jgi:4-hydroxybenzoate polyprenyltransferase